LFVGIVPVAYPAAAWLPQLYAVFQLLISEVDGICDVCGIVYPLASVTAKVPLVVIGDPLIDKPVGTVIATLVTDPDPAEAMIYVFK
jgi:hypothetical protein